jgi:hypothetical protein
MKLHRYLSINIDKIETGLMFDNRITVSGARDSTNKQDLDKKKLFAQLTELLALLGQPPDAGRLAQSANASTGASAASGNINPKASLNVHYIEFINRVQAKKGKSKGVEELRAKNCLYQRGISNERRPVVYYVARRVTPDSFDMDLFLYFLLGTLQSVGNLQFDLVIDCTQFSGLNEWGLESVLYLQKIMPTGLADYLQSVIVLNPSSSFRRYTNKV